LLAGAETTRDFLVTAMGVILTFSRFEI